MARQQPTLLMPTDGSCAFCGKTRREVRAFVGSSIMDVRICDQCLGLCCSVLAGMSGEDERLEEQSAMDFSDERLAAILDLLANKGPRTPPDRAPGDEFRCAFCDQREGEVAALVSGPRVFICDTCTGSAVAFMKRELRTQK